jgi:hypothetical protein
MGLGITRAADGLVGDHESEAAHFAAVLESMKLKILNTGEYHG